MPRTVAPCTVKEADQLVKGRSSGGRPSTDSSREDRPCTTATEVSASVPCEAKPGVHAGQPHSCSTGQSGWPSRTRFHQPLASEAARSEPAASHSGWKTDVSGPPSTTWVGPRAGPGSRSATRSSVPSHGIRGWSQVRKAIRLPSADTRAWSTKSVPSHRTAGSPVPSRRTATRALVTAVLVDVTVAGTVDRTRSRSASTCSPTTCGSA